MKTLSIIILAAGKGERMKSLKPKVLHEVANYPILFHVLSSIKKLNPKTVNLVISEELKKYQDEISFLFPEIKYSIQQEQKGTADAVKAVKKKDGDITLILYADTPLIKASTLKKLISEVKANSKLSILSMIANNPKSYGRVLTLGNNKVIKIVEDVDASKNEKKIKLCNSGVMAVDTKLLNQNIIKVKNENKKKEFYLTDLIELFNIQNLLVTHLQCEYEETLGINDRDDLQKVEKFFQRNLKEKIKSNGVSLLDPNSIYLSYDTKIGKDSVIYPNVYFGPKVYVGDNVKIKSFSHLEGTYINKNCEIGPFARIRPNTNIEEDVKVGNFVEIKHSKIKKNTKLSHLSYIGDATIGKNTNIGAGSITCNFDGLKKHKTIIGDNCFIGSNTSLIAPIEVKKNSIVGAGTVVKRNIESNSTVFRRSELVNKKKGKV
ncbi:MAG: bifunctional N-acetylglucosamine-1-phosphate uridyltransferase/glucosamine-1-phosphate acetyltransferase [Rickettsiales bacterium]|nr:bifunctional N-acetylglucosamine-1-phosphate uridyltransferase/glucosamine-1-phosphate acetyltransferase [Rickettsiales bacterium]OUV53390.1 MAG: UDP-N-acetylglucosamine diphosphorylase/glucosamine-1-phosphate N-acetyltransferase [Rickettsiales bacterium TMED127]